MKIRQSLRLHLAHSRARPKADDRRVRCSQQKLPLKHSLLEDRAPVSGRFQQIYQGLRHFIRTTLTGTAPALVSPRKTATPAAQHRLPLPAPSASLVAIVAGNVSPTAVNPPSRRDWRSGKYLQMTESFAYRLRKSRRTERHCNGYEPKDCTCST